MKNTILKYGLFIFYTLFISLPLTAQSQKGGSDEYDENSSEAPIDNWILLLVFVVLAVITYFLWKQNKKAML